MATDRHTSKTPYLPLEIQQLVFSFLDSRSFHAARNVSHTWRLASIDSVTLAKQLNKLPILPRANARLHGPYQMHRLFDEAARTLMLGLKVQRRSDCAGTLDSEYRRGGQAPLACTTANGSRTVTLQGRTLALYDSSCRPARLLAQRPLNDLKETVGNGPWLKVTPPSRHQLALSSDGGLLAVAQERTVQIYDLTAEPDSFTVNEYISSAAGHYICGLAFEVDDHVLRVRLSGKGTVLYLGSPPAEQGAGVKADIAHWKSKAGLRHALLDSSTLSASMPGTQWRLSGLQLLKASDNGIHFAAQKHSDEESSHYVVGHIKTSTPHNSSAVSAEPHSTILHARLETFLSGWDYILNCTTASFHMGAWEDMPSAHEHHPDFALSPDGSLLALAERSKMEVRHKALTQVFLYRLPVHARIGGREIRGRGWEAGGLQGSDGRDSKAMPAVARIPLCLATIEGAVTDIAFEPRDGPRAFALRIATADTTKRWGLRET